MPSYLEEQLFRCIHKGKMLLYRRYYFTCLKCGWCFCKMAQNNPKVLFVHGFKGLNTDLFLKNGKLP